MSTKYYIMQGEHDLLLNGRTGVITHVPISLEKYLSKYDRPKYKGPEIVLRYDTLEEARQVVHTQFVFGRDRSEWSEGLAICRVTSRFFGLWKERIMLPAYTPEKEETK